MFFLDLTFNLFYGILLFLQKVLFNYFGGVIVIFVQMIGYYYTVLETAPPVIPLAMQD